MAPLKTGLAAWYTKMAAFNVESLFSRRKVVGPPRSIFVNDNLPDRSFDRDGRPTNVHVFVTNQVITSKYTVLTFLPRNLLEQFRRVANVCVVITQIC